MSFRFNSLGRDQIHANLATSVKLTRRPRQVIDSQRNPAAQSGFLTCRITLIATVMAVNGMMNRPMIPASVRWRVLSERLADTQPQPQSLPECQTQAPRISISPHATRSASPRDPGTPTDWQKLNDTLKKPTPCSKLRGIYGFLPFGIWCRPTRCFFRTQQQATGNDQVQLTLRIVAVLKSR